MRIDRNATSQRVRPPEAGFVGDVFISGYFECETPSHLAGATVHFSPGARTPWKMNPLGQTLIIIEGVGYVQTEEEPVHTIRAGDIVHCPAGKWHWDGATSTRAMTYIAVQEQDQKSGVVFGKAVTASLVPAAPEL